MEAALTRHPRVGAAVVAGHEDRLIAYLVPDGELPAADRLREHLRVTLPEHMIPALYLEISNIPLTTNGKRDLTALPAPDSTRPELSTGYRAPAAGTERLLAGIWGDLLGIDRIGTGDNFFDLGGHSLLATRVVSRIRAAGHEVTIADLFDRPTVRELAALIDRTGATADLPPILPADRTRPLPLSFGQERLWFLAQLDPESIEYNVPVPIPFDGPLDVEALTAALTGLVARHEVLRTRLVPGPDGRPVQVIDPPRPFPLVTMDMTEAFAGARTPFDLAEGPLVRATLLRAGEDRHVLALVLHHAVFDGWSSGILLRELAALYEAHRDGRPDPLPPLPVQYADYAAWQRERLSDDLLEEQLGFWRTTLADPPVLELPTDRPRPPVRSTDSDVVNLVVGPDTTTALRELSHRHGATMFMTLLAAYAVLLHRHTGQDDLLVGTPVANRHHPDTEQLIGFFPNTLVLRAGLHGDPTAEELLGRIRATALDAYAHQEVPFERLVDELVTTRDRSRTPLVQTLFTHAVSNTDVRAESAGETALTSAKYELALTVTEAADGLAVSFEYSTAILDRDTVDRLAEHLRTLLEAFAGHAALPVSRLPMLTAAEHDRLREWNDTTVPLPADVTVDVLVTRQARLRPEAIAVQDGARSVSYRELDESSDRLAWRLRELGAGPGEVVALRMERGAGLVVAALAVWKAGAAYLPLDPELPAARLDFMLADSGAAIVLTDTDAAGGRAFEGGPRVPGAPAYLIYTSGSTGVPKGVVVSHRNLVNFLLSMQDDPGMSSADVLLAVTTFGFDIAGLELFLPLIAGARVVVADRATARSPRLLAERIVTSGATILQATPATWQMLVDDGWAGAPRLHALCGGEALPPDLAGALLERTAGLWNLYGPTETTVWSAHQEILAGDPVGLGRPVANTTIHLLDERLHPVPAGVTGEVFIGGAGVSGGYHRRPALTAERFVPDLSGTDGARLYRTGDLARRRADGRLDYLGRTDHQIKLHGHRIEPAEIEKALLDQPGVTAALVTVVHRRLVAYLVTALGVTELRDRLAERLPRYMVPATFVELDAFPLNANGKVDRAALPAPGSDRPDLAVYRAPATTTENALAMIWRNLLGLDRVGADDDFFELGGHSLLAAQAVSRIRAATGADVPLAALFDHPTVAGLAAVVDAVAGGSSPDPIGRADRDGPLPLSFAQQRLWFAAQLDPGSPEYNLALALPLAGPIDVTALTRVFTTVVERHEVLRTRLVAGPDGEPVQVVDPPAPFPLELTGVSVEGHAARPFRLDEEHPLRAALIRLDDERHVLSLSMHHVASDEWSTRLLLHEIEVLYDAYREGRPDPLPPLPVQYADYAIWQRDRITGAVLGEQLAYWRDRLAGAPVLELPADRPRPPVRSTAAGVVDFVVPAALTAALRRLSRGAGATMFMTLAAAYATLLHRHTGQDDVLVGFPVANRGRPETERLIGFFVNTLVLRSRVAGDPTFTELLAGIREDTLSAYAHQDLPFEQLVGELVTERDRSRTPLIQTLLNYVTTAEHAGSEGDSAASTPLARFELTLSIEENADDLRCSLLYSSALFDHDRIERFAGHLLTLLTAVAEDPHRPLSRLPLLTAAERADLTTWNDTALPVEPLTAHELFAAHAARQPAAPAIAGTGVTYGDLDAASDRLARHLLERGIGAETVVGLHLRRGPGLITAILAVWKAGAAYLPLDPAHPADRLAYMLSDSKTSLLITDTEAGPFITDSDQLVRRVPVLRLDDPAVVDPAGTTPDVSVHPEQAAYLIYTSGSTGRPKGVTVTHRGLSNLVGATHQLFPAGPGDTTLQFASPSFDASVSEIIMALTSGATLAIAPGADGLAGLLREHHVTTATLPPSLLRTLEAEDLATLTTLITAGERLDPGLAATWAPRLNLINAYGPTETTVCATAGAITPADSTDAPIGNPIANTTTHLLDQHLNPVPAGVTGDLFIGGPSLARGYRNQPARTATAFVPNPFATDGSRLYRTGDLARRLPDGRLVFLGRTDHQLKIRGHRIEAGEVEAALLSLPAVTDAVVTGHDERLVAYVVPTAPAGLPADEDLRAGLRLSLPEYMVPSVFVRLDALPLNRNGKVDRAALPAPATERADRTVYRAPAGATEEILAGIWGDLLGLDRVGAGDGFFALGGHSLLAIRAVSRIREALHTDLPLAALFDHPTVAGLAAHIDGTAHGPAIPPIRRVERTGPLPLSFAQQRLWFLAQLDPESPEYNVPAVLPIGGELDAEALTAALTALVTRHEVLRTRFVTGTDGVPVQVIDPPATFPLVKVDAGSRREAEDLMAYDARLPFDLSTGPLIRATLIRTAPDRHLLVLCLHHIVTDEWSARILRHELAALYEAIRANEPDPLPLLPVQYADFAVWQRDLLAGPVAETQAEYWRTRLADPPLLALPTDHPRPAVRSTAGAALDFTVPARVTAGLRALARRHGATMFMTLAAAYATLLHRHTGQDDLLIGVPVANREQPETQAMAGLFLNTLVLRVRLDGDPRFAEVLAGVRDGALEAYAHQDLPFERLVDELVDDRDRSRTPLFQTLFTHTTGRPGTAGTVGDPSGTADDMARPREALARFEVALATHEDEGVLSGTFEYATTLFDHDTVRRMAGHLQVLLAAAAADAETPLSALPLLTPGEQSWLRELNAGTAELPPAGGIHELFAEQARTRPDAVAVICGDERVTYAELDTAANRVAHRLRRHGIGPDSVVGFRLDRGIGVIVAILGIWKAGGAYLPLDPAYPEQRLRHMVADSNAQLVIDQAFLDADEEADKANPAETVRVLPDQAAYVIYTSGSTGAPKGVVNTHRGLLNLATTLQPLAGTEAGRPALQFAAFSFDAAAADLAFTLTVGATLVIATGAERDEVTPLLHRHDIRSASIVPSLLATLDPEAVPQDATLIVGSEEFPAPLVREWTARHTVLNAYGPTEAAVITTVSRLGSDTVRPTIGRALPNTRAYLLDSCLRPVPAGVAGEIYIGGAGVARGYAGQPALTASRFVPSPLHTDGSRLYRTGDLARLLPDGSLDFAGRADHQLKVRGYRVEAAEVEAALTTCPGVTGAVVVVHRQRLVAYVVAGGGMPSADDLRDHLRRILPAQMIPSLFVELAALPRNANGKLDRAALPEPEATGADDRQEPGTATEHLIAEVWAELLGVDRVGVTDSFFDLGGHSLLATQAVGRLRGHGHRIAVADLFDHPTVAALGGLLDGRRAEAGPDLVAAVTLRDGRTRQPLFLVHSATGGVAEFAEIARNVGGDRPVIGLQARGLAPDGVPDESVVAMAAAYLDEAITLAPDTPLLIGAWSMGAHIAAEMARQAVAGGHRVDGLYLIAPSADLTPEQARFFDAEEHARFVRLRQALDTAISAPPGTRLTPADEAQVLAGTVLGAVQPEGLRSGDKLQLRAARVAITNFLASVDHVAAAGDTEPYDGRVVVLLPTGDPSGMRRRTVRQWRRLLGRKPTVVDVPGRHHTVIAGSPAASVGRWLTGEMERPR
ncbi:non-ribosomal peptide synthetase [Actinoplanes italicus]|uniref:non-ribosomal peptide synthetase n=1 Tax=Actinoplanes italicus TaxID=113567 RepID=UPI001EF3C849|nr:non-ribosomal peptide synthetase [Actinoplanes italicus]